MEQRRVASLPRVIGSKQRVAIVSWSPFEQIDEQTTHAVHSDGASSSNMAAAE
jgi:hypothetical protein